MIRSIFKFFDVGTDDYQIIECSFDEGTTEANIVAVFAAIKAGIAGGSGIADWNTMLNKPNTFSGFGITVTAETDLTNRINALIALVNGVLANLNTVTKVTLVAAINEILEKVNTNTLNLGTLNTLNTTDITSIVNAINEVNSKVGGLSSLNTTSKVSIVSAINEINTLAVDALTSATATTLINNMKGQANGLVGLNGSSVIDSQYLPSYVDDVIEVANYAALPLTGEGSKIYITIDNNTQFRWTGSAYINIVQSSGTVDWGILTNIPSKLSNFIALTPTLDNVLIGDGTNWTKVSLTSLKESLVFGAFNRQNSSITTGVLAVNDTENGSIQLTKSYRLLRLISNVPVRVRLYTTAAKRVADAARPSGTLPGDDSGVVLEYITTVGLTDVDLCPLVDGFDGKVSPDGLIPYAITNLHTLSTAIDLTLNFIRTE